MKRDAVLLTNASVSAQLGAGAKHFGSLLIPCQWTTQATGGTGYQFITRYSLEGSRNLRLIEGRADSGAKAVVSTCCMALKMFTKTNICILRGQAHEKCSVHHALVVGALPYHHHQRVYCDQAWCTLRVQWPIHSTDYQQQQGGSSKRKKNATQTKCGQLRAEPGPDSNERCQ